MLFGLIKMDVGLLKRKFVVVAVALFSLIPIVSSIYIAVLINTPFAILLCMVLCALSIVALFFNVSGALYYYWSYLAKPWKPELLRSFPTVAIVVPTYNENPGMVKGTLRHLKKVNYPKEKLGYYLLDDSTDREIGKELRNYCKSNGITVIHRKNRKHFKGGALNNFLKKSNEEFIAVFDADETLVDRNFLLETLPYFRNRKVAYVQTTKKFANGSLFANSIDISYSFFFNFIQPARGTHKFPIFCGSCGVLRKDAVEKVGGFPDSLVEDSAFSIKADLAGYTGVYLKKVYALGKPIETFSGFGLQQWRYNFGHTKLIKEYTRNMKSIPLKKHVHYIAHVLGLNYLSVVLILFGLITIMMAFSDLGRIEQSILNLFLPSSLKFQIEFLALFSIIAMFFTTLLISKVYFGSFRYGLLAYLLNFGVAFVRAKAAVCALVKDYAPFRKVERDRKGSVSAVNAFHATSVESCFSSLFFLGGVISVLSADISSAFWLIWYGTMFSIPFLFAYRYG